MSKQWNKEEIKFLKDNYKDMSYKEIAIKLNRTENAIKVKTNKLGLIKSKYIYNKDYFKVIDSEEKAYWLGFIYADGYVCANDTGSELGIELQVGDIEHLKKFNILCAPGSGFSKKGWFRISYCVSEKTILNSKEAFYNAVHSK